MSDVQRFADPPSPRCPQGKVLGQKDTVHHHGPFYEVAILPGKPHGGFPKNIPHLLPFWHGTMFDLPAQQVPLAIAVVVQQPGANQDLAAIAAIPFRHGDAIGKSLAMPIVEQQRLMLEPVLGNFHPVRLNAVVPGKMLTAHHRRLQRIGDVVDFAQ